MPSSAAAAPHTWDDFVALDEDDLRELIDGELVEAERLVLRDGVYAIAQSLADQETFRPDSFEGLEIPLPDLWG